MPNSVPPNQATSKNWIQTSSQRPTVHATHPSSQLDTATISPGTCTAVSLEYASLRYKQHCPLGIYVIPSTENLMIWDTVFFVHQGYYADAILKFRLSFPGDYPEHQPIVQFVTDVFHPLISQNGDFNLSPRFRPWRPKEHHVFHVLHYIKAAFKKHALDQLKESDCLNKEAFRYHNSTSSFAALATQSSLLSQSASALFDQDHPSMAENITGGIVFRKLGPNQLQKDQLKFGLSNWTEDG